jgi:hypothetical protein
LTSPSVVTPSRVISGLIAIFSLAFWTFATGPAGFLRQALRIAIPLAVIWLVDDPSQLARAVRRIAWLFFLVVTVVEIAFRVAIANVR